jgi:hypothetical protein
MELLRSRDGVVVDKAEYWLAIPSHPAGGVRRDLFGFIDLIYLDGSKIVAVQATSRQNLRSRERKILTECNVAAIAWIAAGGKIEVWGWQRLKKPIDRLYWHPTIVEITNQSLGVT